MDRLVRFAFLVFWVLWPSVMIYAQETSAGFDESLQKRIEQWREQIIEQDSRFSSFSGSYDFEEMDEQKVWLIRFNQDDGQVSGYMVIAKNNKSLELVEYGLGDFFPSNADARKRMYAGLESAWIDSENHLMYDPLTVEPLPFYTTPETIPKGTKSLELKTTFLKTDFSLPFAHIYWLRTSEKAQTEEQLKKLIKKQDITFVANLYDGNMLAAYSAAGFHEWNEGLFVELADENGSRFLSFPYLSSIGSFIPERS